MAKDDKSMLLIALVALVALVAITALTLQTSAQDPRAPIIVPNDEVNESNTAGYDVYMHCRWCRSANMAGYDIYMHYPT